MRQSQFSDDRLTKIVKGAQSTDQSNKMTVLLKLKDLILSYAQVC